MPLNALAVVPLLASLVLSYRPDAGTVYIAADSRMTSDDHGLTASGSACKIRVLEGGIVFVGTGNALFSAAEVRTDIYALAALQARSLPDVSPAGRPLTAEQVRQVALLWQREVHARLLAKMQVPVSRQFSAASVTGVTGSFYAPAGRNAVYGVTLRVAPDANGVLQDIEEPAMPAGYLVATGTNEAKTVALASATAPSIASLAWPRRLQAIEAEAIRRQARRYGRRSDIGGPIDMVEVTSRGAVWLLRKPACR